MKLGGKIGSLVGLTTIVASLALSWVGFASFYRILYAQVENYLIAVGDQALNRIDQFLFERQRDIEEIAEAPSLEDVNTPQEIRLKRFREWAVLSGPWDELLFVDKNGTVLVSDHEERIGKMIDEHEEDVFQQALSGLSVHSDAIRGENFDRPTVIFASPVRAEIPGRPVIGVVIGELAWPAVEEQLGFYEVSMHLLNARDEIIATHKSHEPLFSLFSIEPEKIAIFIEQRGFLTYTGNNWRLEVEADRSTAIAPATRIALNLALLMGFIITLIGLGFFALIYLLVVKPMKNLEEGIRKFGAGNLKERINITSKDELGDLAKTFNAMATQITDLTSGLEIKVAERTTELEAEKQRFQAILESMGDGAFVIDNRERIIFFNAIAEKITEYSREEVINKPYKEILRFILEATRDVNDAFVETALRQGKIAHMTNHTLLITKHGNEVPVADSAAPIKDQNGKTTGCVVVFRDVSKEYAIDKLKSEFISLSSHQLRTPLTAIRWALEVIEEGKEFNERQKELLQIAESAAKKMAGIVNALLNITRIESKRLSITPTTIDPETLAKEVITLLDSQIKKKNHKVTLNVAPDIGTITTDSVLLSEILSNLLSNAIKYTPDGGKIDIEVKDQGERLSFTVKDNGFGIPKQQQERVFQKFFRGDNIVTKETEGSGLGLYLVQRLIETIGGKIWFSSREGEGTTFEFTVPKKGLQERKGEVSLTVTT